MPKMRNKTTYEYVRAIALLYLRVIAAAALVSAIALAGFHADASEAVDQAIDAAAFKHKLDPALLHAIAQVESNKNPRAVGSVGEVGLFQLRPEFHHGASFDPVRNADQAARYLASLKVKPRCKAYGRAWFVCHNTGPSRKIPLANPTEFIYYKKVIAARAKHLERRRQLANQ